MRKIPPIVWLVFAAGFVLGLLFFFPLEAVRSNVLVTIRQNTGVDVSPKTLYVGTGLGLGIRKGSLLAIRAEEVFLTFAGGNSIKCRELVVAPQILPLFIGSLAVSVKCETHRQGSVVAKITGRPFWSPKKLNVDATLDKLNLGLAAKFLPAMASLAGSLSGEVNLSEFTPGSRSLPTVSWEINGQDIQLPSVNSDFFSLPSLDLGNLKSAGRLERGRLNLNELSFGGPSTYLQGQLTASLMLDTMGMPQSGDLSGKLRSDSNFEKSQLRDLNLDLSFGKVKESGYREFRKKIEGGVQSLLFNPPLDK